MSNIISRPTELTAFNKAGIAVTNAVGVVNVEFRTAQPYGFSYVVLLTCTDPGQAVSAYPSNITQTGFTITTKNTQVGGGGYAVVGGVTVYWIVRSVYNE